MLEILLHFGLLLSLLITPALVLMAYWYRRQLDKPLMVWKKPEMVIVTITFSVSALILFIVGISCLFNAVGYVETSLTIDQGDLYRISATCGLLIVSLLFTYLAIRMLLVRVISSRGIVLNDRFFRIPDYRNVIAWHEIVDYYLVSDYPNVIFTLIVQKESLQYSRVSLRVPVYRRDEFEDLLERCMDENEGWGLYEGMSSTQFSGN
ncbi:MAG: hypothetical protein AAFQ68_03740 [Bacteroidota bacterium]